MDTTRHRVAALVGAERATFPGSGHSPQQQGERFNERLLTIFAAAGVE